MYKIYALMILISIFFVSCTVEKLNSFSKTNESQNLEKSLLIWKKNKLDNNSAYSFNSDFTSWVGFGNRSKIFVKNEKIVRKEYTSWTRNGKIVEKIIEENDNIGNSKKGIIPKTIDELYKTCKDNILKKDKNLNYIYVGYDKKGILTYCLYSPKHCADDCSKGVRITEIGF